MLSTIRARTSPWRTQSRGPTVYPVSPSTIMIEGAEPSDRPRIVNCGRPKRVAIIDGVIYPPVAHPGGALRNSATRARAALAKVEAELARASRRKQGQRPKEVWGRLQDQAGGRSGDKRRREGCEAAASPHAEDGYGGQSSPSVDVAAPSGA